MEPAPVLWFGWFRADIIGEYAELFWRGLEMTIAITAICIVLGTALGLVIGIARLADARHSPGRELSRFLLRWPSTVYVSFFRGTPLFVQILLIHFALLPILVNPDDGMLMAGDAARELKQNYGALLSGVLCWTLYIVGEPDKAAVAHQLDGHKKGLAQGISPRASPFVGYTIKPLRIPTKP